MICSIKLRQSSEWGVLGKSRGAASTRSVPASAGGCSRQMESDSQQGLIPAHEAFWQRYGFSRGLTEGLQKSGGFLSRRDSKNFSYAKWDLPKPTVGLCLAEVTQNLFDVSLLQPITAMTYFS